MHGYTGRLVPVRYANGPLLRVPKENAAKWVLMEFQGTERSVLSGLMRGVAETRARPCRGRCAGGPGARDSIRHQPVLPLAESGRVRDAGKCDSVLESLVGKQVSGAGGDPVHVRRPGIGPARPRGHADRRS